MGTGISTALQTSSPPEKGRLLILNPADGATLGDFAAPTIKGRHETLRWAQLEKGVTAVLHYPGGWPAQIPVLVKNGAVLWSYPPKRGSGVNAATWAGLDGDGSSEMILGCNGSPALCVVSSRGEKIWETNEVLGADSVAGIGPTSNQPGLVLCTSVGKVHVFDASGRHLRALDNHDFHAMIVGIQQINASEERQVLTLAARPVGRGAVALAQDVDGKLLWTFPLSSDLPRRAVSAEDLTGDGVNEWIIEDPDQGVALVLDTKGVLLATLSQRFIACFGVQGKAGPGLLCVATSNELIAFTLAE